MPTMANITVQNQAAANVVYVASVPSAGDKTPAKWTQNAISAILGWRPVFTLLTRDNGNKNGRHLTATLKYPVIDPNGGGVGIPRVTATVPLTLDCTLPTNVDGTIVQEAFVQMGNLLVSSLVRSSAAEGYAPT